jgi:uncharacterized protein with NRDE domain
MMLLPRKLDYMCLATFAFGISENYPLIFAANRDELHARPTAAANWWTDYPNILGGRDLLAGGTWLAIDQCGRLAAITNVPTAEGKTFKKSRGHLVTDYLASKCSADSFISQLQAETEDYAPYNLLIFDDASCHYFSNQTAGQQLVPGIYALSNAPLGTPWPKVCFAESMLASTLAINNPVDRLFKILENKTPHHVRLGEEELDWRQTRVFIKDEQFGTRSSTVILISRTGEVQFFERCYNSDGTHTSKSDYSFNMKLPGTFEATR